MFRAEKLPLNRELDWSWWRHAFFWGLIVLAVGLFAFRCYKYGGYFAEDAYISFRFASNLAAGHGLVWNIGQEPVEGYSSPLHILLLVAGLKTGLPISTIALLISYLSVVGLIGLFLLLLRQETGALTPFAALVIAIYLIDSRLAIHTTAGLDTVLFMFVLAGSYAASIYLVKSPSWRAATDLVIINLLCLLTRPDAAPYIVGQAVIIAAYSLYLAVTQRQTRWLRYAALSYGLLCLIGVMYLAWKYVYFGYLLPNPFYIKSNRFSLNGLRHVREFLQSLVTNYGLLIAPILFLLDYTRIAAWWKEPGVKLRATLLLGPPTMFLLYYTTVIHEVGYADRFEYPTYFFFCLATAIFLSVGSPTLAYSRLSLAGMVVGVLFFFFSIYKLTTIYFPWFQLVEDGYYRPIGEALRSSNLGPQGKLVFTSAGVVPFVSEFTHIDPVGLTDNFLSGRQPVSAWERERYIWGQDPDVYIGPEPPASPGAADCASDPLSRSEYMQEVFGIYRTALTYLNSYGKLSDQERCEVLHWRMRELRDRWAFIGEIPYPHRITPHYTTFAYVRHGSPYFTELVQILQPLITRQPAEINLGAPAPSARNLFLRKAIRHD